MKILGLSTSFQKLKYRSQGHHRSLLACEERTAVEHFHPQPLLHAGDLLIRGWNNTILIVLQCSGINNFVAIQ